MAGPRPQLAEVEHHPPRGEAIPLRKARTYLLVGVVTLLPVLATWVSLRWFFVLLDRIVRNLFPQAAQRFLPGGVGVLLGIIVLLLTGVAVTHFGGRYMVRSMEWFLNRLPVVKTFYGTARSITDALLGNSRMAFQEAVLIEYPKDETYTLAFITGKVGNAYSLFVPTTPNPTSGWYLLLPPERVVTLKTLPVDEAIKMIMSGGVISPGAAAHAEVDQAMARLRAISQEAKAR